MVSSQPGTPYGRRVSLFNLLYRRTFGDSKDNVAVMGCGGLAGAGGGIGELICPSRHFILLRRIGLEARDRIRSARRSLAEE